MVGPNYSERWNKRDRDRVGQKYREWMSKRNRLGSDDPQTQAAKERTEAAARLADRHAARQMNVERMPSMAAGPAMNPAPSGDYRTGALAHGDLVYSSHAHAKPSHHVGPCDDACRRGFKGHYHRPQISGPK